MRLGYFTMPMHPEHRSPTDTLHENREAIILADKLGFHDAFVGEHLTEKTENIVSSLLFLATLIPSTKTIKLATGTSTLSQWHPAMIASRAAMFDHLAKGRFIFGISAGGAALRCGSAADSRTGPAETLRRLHRRHHGNLEAQSALRTSICQGTSSRSRRERKAGSKSAVVICTSPIRSRVPRS